MATYSIVGTPLNFASVANAPTSVGGTVTATTAGNLLVYVVTATSSGTPTISNPGGAWVAAYNTSIAGLAYACFYQLNNAGGITTVSSNVATTTAGGAAGTFFEIKMNNPVVASSNYALEYQTSYNQTGTSTPWTGITNLTNFNDFIMYFVHMQSTTVTGSLNTVEWTFVGNNTSTGSTTNAKQELNYCNPYESLSQPTGGFVGYGASVPNALGYVRFSSAASYPIEYSIVPNSGNSGYINPNKFQGMIGG